MLDLRRLRLLHELHERGTIAAVADALHFTPSAVSQQLAVLEREAGVPLLERAGRGVRLTDAALVLVGHADALLDRAALAEADLAAAAGSRRRPRPDRGFQSVALRLAIPAIERLAQEARACAASSSRQSPRCRCRRSRSETSTSCSPTSGSTSLAPGRAGVDRHDLHDDPVRVVAPGGVTRSRAGAALAVPLERARRRGLDDRPPRHAAGTR